MDIEEKQLLVDLSNEVDQLKDRTKALENRCKLLEKDAEEKKLETFG